MKPQTAPYFLVSYNDGLVLTNFLRSNPGVPLLANMTGAGTIDPTEKQIVKDIYTAV